VQTAPSPQFTGHEPTLLHMMLHTEPGAQLVLHVPTLLQSTLQTEPVSHLKSQRPVTLLQLKFAVCRLRATALQPVVLLHAIAHGEIPSQSHEPVLGESRLPHVGKVVGGKVPPASLAAASAPASVQASLYPVQLGSHGFWQATPPSDAGKMLRI
jgi:hypothetical protein